MTREQYDELSAPLVRVLLDMEDDILREIAAQLSRDGDISDTSKWRIRQLARAGRFDKRAAAIIAGYSEVEDGQAMGAGLTAAETEIGYLDNAVQAANAAGLSEYFSDIPAETSAMNAAKAFQRQAASGLNLVNTVMGYKAKSAYVNAVNAIYRDTAEGRQGALDIMGKGAAKSVSGQMSLQEATRKTIRELAQKGIPAFVDKRGREWSPEAYVMMDMRSTLGNTARAAQDARCDQYGINLIEVSSHMGARPLCAAYQGRLFSRDDSKGVTTDGAGGKIYYTPLSETSYGQPAGLFGINCGHVQYPFVPGINFQRYFPYPKEENDRRYMQFQQQRAMERGIRAAKRECMMLQETGDTEGLQKASLRLRNQREKYRAYCKETGLKQHNDRTQVYGYDRSKSSKTVWAERKASKNSGATHVTPFTPSGGQADIVNVPAKSIHQQIHQAPVTKPTFNNAESIEEAKAYARSIGVEHPDYSKFTLERANNMNMALSTLPDDSMPYVVTDLQKYTSVTGAPLGKAQKSGYACTVTPYEIDLQRAGIADIPRTIGSGNTIVAVNTRNYKTIDSITESKAKSEELVVSRNLGKSYHFNKDGKATDFHECGHVYATKHDIPTGFSADADHWYKETGCMILQTTSEAWSEAYAAYYTHADDLPPYIRRYFDKGEWKDGSGSKVLSLDEWYQKLLDNGSKSGIINTGAISGALNPYSKEAEKHAVQYYESVRHMKTDTQKISAATGISRDKIDKIKNHVFITEHDLLTGHKRFDPSYDMAQSWQRLINGDFKEQDIVLLKHEYAELRYMEKGYSQNEAHILASKKYNYAKYCE